jgi:uncharacterized protein YggE
MAPTEEPATNTPPPAPNKRLSISFSPWLIVVLLILAIGAMLLFWKPWEAQIKADTRTTEVTGTATLKAEPDEYTFYPTYEFKDADKDAALMELTKKSEAIVAELKRLGVSDNQIKTNSSGYSQGLYFPVVSTDGSTTYSLSLTVTIGDKELAQKVQDYLVTTSPTGAVSPQATFSTAKQKELESQARDQATKDARSKAEQSAKNLGFKLAQVKSVTDGAGFGGPIPLYSRGAAEDSIAAGAPSQLDIQPGENDLSYSVTVVYFIK